MSHGGFYYSHTLTLCLFLSFFLFIEELMWRNFILNLLIISPGFITILNDNHFKRFPMAFDNLTDTKLYHRRRCFCFPFWSYFVYIFRIGSHIDLFFFSSSFHSFAFQFSVQQIWFEWGDYMIYSRKWSKHTVFGCLFLSLSATYYAQYTGLFIYVILLLSYLMLFF